MSADDRPLTPAEIDAALLATIDRLQALLQDTAAQLDIEREAHAETQARWLALEHRRN
jgi:hypothetical protein